MDRETDRWIGDIGVELACQKNSFSTPVEQQVKAIAENKKLTSTHFQPLFIKQLCFGLTPFIRHFSMKCCLMQLITQ